MTASTYIATQFINHAFGGTAMTQPAAWWLDLHTADPGAAGTSNVVTGGNYARKQCTAWSRSTNSANNTNAIEWLAVTWTATVSHFSIHDASTAGNCLGYGALTASKSVASGDDAKFAATALTVTIPTS